MGASRSSGGTHASALFLLVLVSAPVLGSNGQRVIPPGHEQDILALAAPIRLGGQVAEGYRLANIGIEGRSFTFILDGEGLAPVHVRLAPDDEERNARVEVRPPESQLSAAARRAVERLRAQVLPRVDAAFWERVLSEPTVGREIRSPPLSTLPAYVVTIAAFLLILWVDARRSRSFWSVLSAALLALVPLIVWYVSWGDAADIGQNADDIEAWRRLREHHLVKLTLGVAIAATAAATLALVRGDRRVRVDRALYLDASLVLAWSLVVRFGLTAANVLTDGGSGWSRLLEYRRGFGALAVLLDLVLPDASMWDSIFVPRLLAALSPPVLVLLARALGATRRAAVFAGFAFASWPVHAALYTSDFESGAIVTLLLVGLTLVSVGVNRNAAAAVASGLCVVAFALFGRPEMLVVGLPLLAVAWGAWRQVWSRPAVIAAVAWIGVLAIVRVLSVSGLGTGSWDSLAGPWNVLPLREILTTSALFPYWIWLPLPLGVLCLRGRARVAAFFGLIAGIVPIHATPTMFDPTETYLEFFRYGAFAMPWVALLAGAGLACAVTLLSHLLPRVAPAATAAVLGLFLATPLLDRDYLGLQYGPAVDEETFRRALTHVPANCRLIVPDDQQHFDTLKRYVEIARDVASRNADAPSPEDLVGLSRALRNPRRDGCWYFYRGSYCHDGFEGIAPAECRELLEREGAVEVWSREVEYRSHRLVTRPRRKAAPWYERNLRLSLYRLR